MTIRPTANGDGRGADVHTQQAPGHRSANLFIKIIKIAGYYFNPASNNYIKFIHCHFNVYQNHYSRGLRLFITYICPPEKPLYC